MAKGVVLVADDDASVRTVVNRALLREGYEVRVTSNFSTLWQWIESGAGDCVVSDVIMPDGEAFDILPKIRRIRPNLPVILISAQNTFMTAIRAQEGNAFEYLPKPFDLNDLTVAVGQGIFEAGTDLPATRQGVVQAEMPLSGRSAAMQEIYRQIAHLRGSALPVFLSGEDGVGKTHIARVIHRFSRQSEKPFHLVSLAGMPETQIHDAIFGDATTQAGGKINKKGTLFIDDILDLPAQSQNMLLQLLLSQPQDHEGNPGRCRLIVATSENPRQAVREGRFRQDLYFRLAALPLYIPPLRQRLDDIPDLVRHFLQMPEITGGHRRHLEPAAMQLLKKSNWPGNVVELENFIRRLCLLVPHGTITEKAIREQLDPGWEGSLSSSDISSSSGHDSLEAAAAHFATAAIGDISAHNSTGLTFSEEEGVYSRLLSQFEPPVIIAALKHCNGNQIRAANLLGINRNTLRKKIRQYGIEIIKTVN